MNSTDVKCSMIKTELCCVYKKAHVAFGCSSLMILLTASYDWWHREYNPLDRTFVHTEKSENKLFVTLPIKIWFPNYTKSLIKRTSGNFLSAIEHGGWFEFFQNYSAFTCLDTVFTNHFHFSFAFFGCFHQNCYVVQSLEQEYLICVLTVANRFVSNFWQVFLSKSTSFFSFICVKLLCLLFVCLLKGSTVYFLLN